jgi:hypothetical protein
MPLITTFVELRVIAGRSRTQAGHPDAVSWTTDANSHIPCHAHAALCRGLEKSLSERHGRCMAFVNQTRPHWVNQMGKTLSKPSAERHGRGMGTAWYVWISLNSDHRCLSDRTRTRAVLTFNYSNRLVLISMSIDKQSLHKQEYLWPGGGGEGGGGITTPVNLKQEINTVNPFACTEKCGTLCTHDIILL